jgi:hypothetical protein
MHGASIQETLEIEAFFSFDLGSGTAGWLSDCCGIIGRLYLAREVTTKTQTILGKQKEVTQETGRFVRRLLTQLHPNFAAGVRGASPSAVPPWIENPTYEKIRAVIEGDYETTNEGG